MQKKDSQKKLRECPLCGGEDVEHLPDGFGNWLVGCVTCDYRIQCVSCTEDEAVRYWNTRPAEDALKAEVERLKTKAGRAETWLDSLSDMLQKIITVTSSENSKKLDPEETVKWINDRARHVIEVMNEVYRCGTDSNVPTNAPDTKKGEKNNE